jgi:pimeloyl-ACP methyl ester carboxylesterase
MLERHVLASALVAFACVLPSLHADELKSATFDANGVKIHYLTQGDGEPVVLVHGLHSNAMVNWKLPGIIDALAQSHLVVAIDLPGHGQSEKPEAESAYGTQLSEDVVLLLDHLHIDKAHVVGYSLGGMVVARQAADHPDRMISLTLGGMGWLRAGSGLQRFWEFVPARGQARTPTALINGIGELALTEDELKSIRIPAKVLIGDRDPVNKMYVAPLRAVRDDWPIDEIKDAGHITCVLQPDFRAGLVEWIESNSGR